MKEFIGKVAMRPFAVGSKSERDAVWLDTPEGSFVLRRQGANPLYDPELETLVGKTITAHGEVADGTLTITGWKDSGS